MPAFQYWIDGWKKLAEIYAISHLYVFYIFLSLSEIFGFYLYWNLRVFGAFFCILLQQQQQLNNKLIYNIQQYAKVMEKLAPPEAEQDDEHDQMDVDDDGADELDAQSGSDYDEEGERSVGFVHFKKFLLRKLQQIWIVCFIVYIAI